MIKLRQEKVKQGRSKGFKFYHKTQSWNNGYSSGIQNVRPYIF